MNERRLRYQAGLSEPFLGHGVVTSKLCESRIGPAVTVSEGPTYYAVLEPDCLSEQQYGEYRLFFRAR